MVFFMAGRVLVKGPSWIRPGPCCHFGLQRLEETRDCGDKMDSKQKRSSCTVPVPEGTCCPSGTFLLGYAHRIANLCIYLFLVRSPGNETGKDVSGNDGLAPRAVGKM